MMDSSRFNTLVDMLWARADSKRRLTFIDAQGAAVVVSFGEMLQRALQRLSTLQATGVKSDDYLIIQSSDNALFIEAFWACLLGGITAVPLTEGSTQEHRLKLFRIVDMLDTPFIYTDSTNLQRLESYAVENNRQQTLARLQTRFCNSSAVQGCADDAIVVSPQSDATAFVQFSSGSTSTPKGIVLTHKNLLANTYDIIEGCQITSDDELLSWMPLTHDMGLIGFHLVPLLCDVNHAFMPTALFVRRPALWLTEVQRLKVTISCSPNFGYQHLLKSFQPGRFTDLDISSMRLIFNGAEPISALLCEQFVQTLKPFGLPEDVMYPVYGLAEASLAVSFPPLHARFKVLTIDRASLSPGEAVVVVRSGARGAKFVSVGKPLPSTEVELRDADNRPCAELVCGRIYIRGDNVTQGYLNEPELSAELISAERWLDTGDLGFVADGQLYIAGRAKDVIFVHGQNVYPHDMEEILILQNVVERGKVAVASSVAIGDHTNDNTPSSDVDTEDLLVFVMHRGDVSELEALSRDITRTLGTQAGVAVDAVVAVPRIPKTTSGKVQRFQLLRDYQAGEFQVLRQARQPVEDQPGEQMLESAGSDAGPEEASTAADSASRSAPLGDRPVNGESTYSQLLDICNRQIENMNVAADDNLFELGISSLTLAEIHAAIDEQWPNQVDITDLFDYPTVAELAAFLDARE